MVHVLPLPYISFNSSLVHSNGIKLFYVGTKRSLLT